MAAKVTNWNNMELYVIRGCLLKRRFHVPSRQCKLTGGSQHFNISADHQPLCLCHDLPRDLKTVAYPGAFNGGLRLLPSLFVFFLIIITHNSVFRLSEKTSPIRQLRPFHSLLFPKHTDSKACYQLSFTDVRFLTCHQQRHDVHS